MFDRTSRYFGIEQATVEVSDGNGETRSMPFVRRRFIPPAPTHPPSASHTVTEGDRLDLIANRYLGDPTLFWSLVDGSNAIDPAELTREPGTVIDVFLPGLEI